MDLNRAQIIGRITQNPELKQTASGQSVVSFSVATNRVWKDSSGEKKESAEFHNIVAWGKLAEIIANYAKKGKKIYVEGRLQTRSWEDSSGAKHWKTEIVAENIILLDSKSSESKAALEDDAAAPAAGDDTAKEAKAEEDISIEDVPF